MKKISIIFLFLAIICQSVLAVQKEEADQAYQNNDFSKAIELYNSILNDTGESAAIYYNLGNSYYKADSIGKAILNYERALMLNPNDGDIKFNLEMAKSKTIDKITPKNEVFLVSWANAIISLMNESSWAKLAIASFMVFLLSVAVYLFNKKSLIKKIGFSLALVALFICIFSNVFADSQKEAVTVRTKAIVIEPSVTVRSTPDESGTELFVLHEGTKICIEDNTMSSWKEVSLEDGNRGWIKTSMIEII